MTGPPDPDSAPARPRRRRLLKIAAVVVIGVLLIAGIGGVVAYQHLDGNIGRLSLTDPATRPPKVTKRNVPHQPLNVLLIGSDTRTGQKGHIGGDTPGLSDTTIVLHLSANRQHAYAVSIPRDSMVQRPACKRSDGSTDPAELTQFNDAYAIGGPQCTRDTVEALTNLYVDHVVVIDFNGFRSMVNALGGVEVCLPEEVNDDVGHIHLAKGTYVVRGGRALDYVRVRHGIGDGGDLGRIKRQQAFLASLTNKAVSAGTLVNPKRLYDFLDAVTSSISADSELGRLTSLFGLGRQLRGIGLDNVRFLTVATEPYPADTNRLQWAQPAARKLWTTLKNDDVLGAKQTEDSTSAATGAKQSVTQKQRAAAYGLCG